MKNKNLLEYITKKMNLNSKEIENLKEIIKEV